MNKPEITIYGFGFVGRAVYDFLKRHYELQIFDSVKHEPFIITDLQKLTPTKYAIICVPTAMLKNGECDISIVEETVKNSRHDFYLIKSTIVPGTTKKLIAKTKKRIAFSPEYIGEGRYHVPFWKGFPHPTDMKLHEFHIFGGEKAVTKKWIEIWQKVAGWGAVYAQTDSTTAELVKYMENSFLAVKKIFCDEFYDIAETFGVDYNELRELLLLDGRVGRSMTLIYPESRGFGGKCLPKDVTALVKHAENAGYEPQLLKQALVINKKLRKNQK